MSSVIVMQLLDKDGYPTKKTLKKISKWNVKKDPKGLIDLLLDVWQWGEKMLIVRKGFSTGLFRKAIMKIEMHTGGWSGNESIIEALKKHEYGLFLFYLEKEIRGGHYYFEIPIKEWLCKVKM